MGRKLKGWTLLFTCTAGVVDAFVLFCSCLLDDDKALAIRKEVGLAALLVLLALVPWVSGGGQQICDQEKAPVLTLLDVGQESSSVIETPNGVVLVDCGSQRRPSVGSWTIAPFLFDRGCQRIDVMVFSHADADHINGAASLIERFAVSEVWVGRNFASDDQGKEALAWITPRVGGVRFLEVGDRLEFDGLQFQVMWPDTTFIGHAMGSSTLRSEGSLVPRAELGFISVLFMGDAENAASLGMHDYLVPVDVLIAPHHGSAFTNLPNLLKKIRPSHVLISGREKFSPVEVDELHAEGAEVWHTYDRGAIRVSGHKGTVKVAPWMDERNE